MAHKYEIEAYVPVDDDTDGQAHKWVTLWEGNDGFTAVSQWMVYKENHDGVRLTWRKVAE